MSVKSHVSLTSCGDLARKELTSSPVGSLEPATQGGQQASRERRLALAMRHSGVLLGLLLGAVSGGHMAAAADDDNITMLVWRDNAVCAHK